MSREPERDRTPTGPASHAWRLRVPPGLVNASELTWRAAIVAAGLVGLAWLLVTFRLVTVPALFALLAATVLQPAVDALRRRRWPDLAAAWAVLLAALAVVVGTVALLAPTVADQSADFDESLEGGISEVEKWLRSGPLGLDDVDLQQSLDQAVGRAAESDALVDSVTLAGEILAGAFMAIVMTFFFIKDGHRITGWALSLVPAERRDAVAAAGGAGWAALSAFVRGTAIVGVVNGVVIGIGLAIIGVPLAVPLGVITAISAFFPLVGAVVAGAIAVLIALFTGGVTDALLVLGLVVIVQQVEGDVLSPIVMGRALSLHPLVILVAITSGAVAAGLVGAFLAVPVVGVTVAVVTALRHPSTS